MKGTILLNYDANTREVEEEERTSFLRTILEQMGIPIDDFWSTENSLSVSQKIKLRNILSTYEVQVLDDLDGFLQIYVGGEKVAEWIKPTYKLKRDLRELNPRKQLYLEMEIEFWSLFEEPSQQEL